jgi:hypothetical protein
MILNNNRGYGHGPYLGSNKESRFSIEWVTSDTRNVIGLLSLLAVVGISYVVFQFSGLFFYAATIGPLVVGLIALDVLAASVVIVFYTFRNSVTLLLVPMGIFACSMLITGLSAWIVLSILALCVIHIFFFFLKLIVNSRLLAIAIASLPVIGAGFYVATHLDAAGLTFAQDEAGDQNHSQQLAGIQSSLAAAGGTAVLHYRIIGKRVLADLHMGSGSETIPLPVDELVRTPFRWLERRVEGQLESSRARSSTSPFTAVIDKLRNYATVMVADGDLINLNHRSYLPNRRLLRSFSLNTEAIAENGSAWSKGTPVALNSIEVLDGMPSTEEHLRAVGLPTDEAPAWAELRGSLDDALRPLMGSGTSVASKARFLEALQTKQLSIVIVAHSDGLTIRLPDGSSITTADLAAVREHIRANRPLVFLFSCDTARTIGTSSFAKILLDQGARAVIAPVTKIAAKEAIGVIESFVRSVTSTSKPGSLERAFEKANTETGSRAMEVWIAARHDAARTVKVTHGIIADLLIPGGQARARSAPTAFRLPTLLSSELVRTDSGRVVRSVRLM